MTTSSRKTIKVYIDECGGDGFKHSEIRCKNSSEWLTFTAVILLKTDEPNIIKVIDTILDRGWRDCGDTPPKIHWRNFSHSHKLMIADELAQLPVTTITVGMWKTKLYSSFLTTGINLFRYAAKLLIERISWYAVDQNAVADVVFGARSKTYDSDMMKYIKYLITCTPNGISPTFNVGNLKFLPTDQRKMLLVADMYAGIHSNALERDRMGYLTPRYLHKISHQVYEFRGKRIGYGLKLFPDAEVQKAMEEEYKYFKIMWNGRSWDLLDSA